MTVNAAAIAVDCTSAALIGGAAGAPHAPTSRVIVNKIVNCFILPPVSIILITFRCLIVHNKTSDQTALAGACFLWSHLEAREFDLLRRDLKCPCVRVVNATGLADHVDGRAWIITPGPQVITSLHEIGDYDLAL